MLRIAFHKPVERVAKKLKKFLSSAKLYPKISILKTCCSKLEKPRRPWCRNTWATVCWPII